MNLKEGDIIAVNKPRGLTSHDVVDKIRKVTGVRRVGHGGTLDPLASGVLVIGIGRNATRQLEKYVQGEKEYEAVVKLGETSTTDDEEGEKSNVSKKVPTREEVTQTLPQFIGTITQTPPVFSALKVKGKPAYKYARQGRNTSVFMNRFIGTKTREVEIKSITIGEYNYPLLTVRVTCGKGVYIRSLARDIGEKLGTGAYLADLTRTRVAEFDIKNTISVDRIDKKK